eukprot:m.212099 g.212099  ORF g.212099 m.212099 type:complete len:150 (+) comp15847_c0_seq5:3120-3569(+)
MPNCCCKCCCVPICGTCVGLKRQETAKMNEWFLKELPPKGAPSCFERCYFCRCGMDPIPITVPDKFTGVTYQMGGSKRCQTMQQGKWDNEKRRLVLPIQYPGTWALGDHNWCMVRCLRYNVILLVILSPLGLRVGFSSLVQVSICFFIR